jgi:hypothetical protein
MSNKIPEGYKWNLDHPKNELQTSYDEFKLRGWKDKDIIYEGYLIPIAPPPAAPTKPTVADAWGYFEGKWPKAAASCQEFTVIITGSISLFSGGWGDSTGIRVCTREQFESYGRNRVWQDEKTAKAISEKLTELAEGASAGKMFPVQIIAVDKVNPVTQPSQIESNAQIKRLIIENEYLKRCISVQKLKLLQLSCESGGTEEKEIIDNLQSARNHYCLQNDQKQKVIEDKEMIISALLDQLSNRSK